MICPTDSTYEFLFPGDILDFFGSPAIVVSIFEGTALIISMIVETKQTNYTLVDNTIRKPYKFLKRSKFIFPSAICEKTICPLKSIIEPECNLCKYYKKILIILLGKYMYHHLMWVKLIMI